MRPMLMGMTGVGHMRGVLASALLVAVLAVAAPSASAGGGGGVGMPGGGGNGGGGNGGGGNGGGDGKCRSKQFGDRSLERGDCGNDVATLNWLLRSRDYGVSLEQPLRRHDP